MGVGISLGIALLAALAAIAILMRRVRTLQRQGGGNGQVQELPSGGMWSMRRRGAVPVELPVEQKYPLNEMDGGQVNGWGDRGK